MTLRDAFKDADEIEVSPIDQSVQIENGRFAGATNLILDLGRIGD